MERETVPLVAESKPVRLLLSKLANYRITWEAAGLLMPRRGLDFFARRMDEATVDEAGKKAAEMLQSYVKSDSVVLDLGCGLGRVARHLAPLCKTLYAADISSAYCARARTYLKSLPNTHVVRVDGISLKIFPDSSFDLVYSWEVLVHAKLEVVQRYFAEVRRVLKVGGVFYFHLPKPEIVFPPFEWYFEEDFNRLLASSRLVRELVVEGKDEVTIVMKKKE